LISTVDPQARHVHKTVTRRQDGYKAHIAVEPDTGIITDCALSAANGTVVYRFHRRDLHLVLGPGSDGKPVRFRVTVDETAPGNDPGADINAAGEGVINEQRLYQLIRQKGPSPNAHSKFVLLSRCGNLRVYIRLI